MLPLDGQYISGLRICYCYFGDECIGLTVRARYAAIWLYVSSLAHAPPVSHSLVLHFWPTVAVL